MSVYRLKEEHPVAQKVRKLEDLADELGLTIDIGWGDQIVIQDNETGQNYKYKDIEQSFDSHDSTSSFPYGMETKLIYSDEEEI